MLAVDAAQWLPLAACACNVRPTVAIGPVWHAFLAPFGDRCSDRNVAGFIPLRGTTSFIFKAKMNASPIGPRHFLGAIGTHLPPGVFP
jgi:hypothetical protein